MYAIYKHENLINRKIYIGQTKYFMQPEKRWSDGTHYNCKLKKDLLIYDWNKHFSHKVLLIVETKEEADIYECYFIQFYQSIDFGYNIAEGGNHIPRVNTIQFRNKRKRPKFLKIINANSNKIVFYGKTLDALYYFKNNIFPLMTLRDILIHMYNHNLISSELSYGDAFYIER